MSTTRPSKPSSRSVSAAFAPARLAPTITWVWSLLMDSSLRKGQELLAGAGVVAHEAAERRRDRGGPQLLDAAQGHAHVLRLEHHAHALGLELPVKPIRHLDGQPLLDLEIAAEVLDHAAELAEPDDPLIRQVAHVRNAVERQQVVHAERMERDRASDDQLVVALVVRERGRPERLRGE